MAVYQIWTLQISRARKVADREIHLLDTTVKSGNRLFAPSWEMVMGHKEGTISDAEYTATYLARMAKSRLEHPAGWATLLDHTKVAVMCYCTPGKFCHRHLFVPIMKQYLEDQGHTVQLMGELNAPAHMTQPESIVSIPRPQEIVTFYGKEDLLSSFNPTGYTVKGIRFAHDEQFMMYCKARLFGDLYRAELILNEPDPMGCKRLGKRVYPFDEDTWVLKRRPIVFRGSLQKARENQNVREYLLSTNNALIVEASPTDDIWGVKLKKDDPRIQDPSQWQGLNLRGYVWMDVRRVLQEEIVF